MAVAFIVPTRADAHNVVNALITAAETERRRGDPALAGVYEALADGIGDGVDALPRTTAVTRLRGWRRARDDPLPDLSRGPVGRTGSRPPPPRPFPPTRRSKHVKLVTGRG